MKIGIIGHRNHAARMLRLLARHRSVQSLRVFHPDASKLVGLQFKDIAVDVDTTSDLRDLFSLDGVVIASPSNTHASYVSELIHHRPWLLCEKPPAVNRADLDRVATLTPELRRKILFNFHLPRTPPYQHVKKRILDGELGRLVHASFTVTHGIAFRESFASNWRFTDSNCFSTIVGNLGIHYVHLCLDLFGEARFGGVHTASVSGASQPDTAHFSLVLPNNSSASVTLSYASPHISAATLLFSNGYVSVEGGIVKEFSPRDSFDAEGRFCAPPHQVVHASSSSTALNEIGLSENVDFFLSKAASREPFDERAFLHGIRACELILELNEATQ